MRLADPYRKREKSFACSLGLHDWRYAGFSWRRCFACGKEKSA